MAWQIEVVDVVGMEGAGAHQGQAGVQEAGAGEVAGAMKEGGEDEGPLGEVDDLRAAVAAEEVAGLRAVVAADPLAVGEVVAGLRVVVAGVVAEDQVLTQKPNSETQL